MKKQSFVHKIIVVVLIALWTIPGFIGIGLYRTYSKLSDRQELQKDKSINNSNEVSTDCKDKPCTPGDEHVEKTVISQDKQNALEERDIAEKSMSEFKDVDMPSQKNEKISIDNNKKVSAANVDIPNDKRDTIQSPIKETVKVASGKSREDYEQEHDKLLSAQMNIMEQLME